MPRDQGDLDRALTELSERLDRIEARLGIPKRPLPPPVDSATVQHAPPVHPLSQALSARDLASGHRIDELEELARKHAAVHAAPSAPQTLVPPPVASHAEAAAHPATTPPTIPLPARAVAPPIAPHPPVVKKRTPLTLEQLVGAKVFAVLGGLFLVITLGMFLKLGVDRGWFSFPPVYRCIGGGVFGALLVMAGEFVRRKLGSSGKLVGAAIAGAGLAAMYGSAFAAYGLHGIIDAPAAFTLLALISTMGVGLALYAGSLPLAILALVGAYINPLLMWKEKSSALVMPSYLIALLVLGLVLSAWRPRPFRWLRSVVWWGTSIMGLIWIFPGGGVDHPFIALGFLALVWPLVHGELFFGARRVPEDAPGTPGLAFLKAARPMISSFATTIWTVGVGVLVVHFTDVRTGLENWYVTAAGLVGTGVAAMMLAGNLRAFRDPPETDAERLGVALWTQAGSLVITSVALALSDWTQVVAWLSMGLAALAAGRWAKAKALEGYGLVVLGIAAARLVVYDSWNFAGAGERMLGLVFTRWTLLMAIGGAAWLGAAWLLNRPSGDSPAPSRRRTSLVNVCIGIGITLAFAGLVYYDARAVALVAACGAWAFAVLLAAHFRRSLLLRAWAAIGLFGTSAVASVLHLNPQVFAYGRMHVGPLVVTDWSLVLFGLALVWLVGAWVTNVTAGILRSGGAIVGVSVAVGLTLLATLTDGTSSGAVCVLWIAIGLGLAVAHTLLRRFAMDIMALAVMALTMGLWTYEYVEQRSWTQETMAVMAHPGLWVALGIVAATFVCTAWLARGKPQRASWMPAVNIARGMATVLLFACTSLEVSRSAWMLIPNDHTAQGAALSIWWGLFAVGMIVSGFAAKVPLVRHVGLGLLVVATLKTCVFDLAEVRLEWKVVSFAALGFCMLGVALGYAWLDKRARKAEKAAEEAAMTAP